MPRIDPLSLLKCLSVLLGPTGGIKSKEEVHRLANLMTKFSKKLVSKCIYIQILKTTNAELLSQFMGAGGWNLIHMWLTDGILAKNWALIQELLELLLLCPVDIERLKSNNCPKLIKGLSKEGSQEAVQMLAGRLVEQWLKIVKGEAAPNSLPPQIITNQTITTMGGQPQQITGVVTSGQQRHQTADGIKAESHDIIDNTTTIQVQDLDLGNSSTIIQETGSTRQHQQQYQDQIHIQPVQLQIINKTMPGQTQPTQIKKQSFVVVSSASSSHPPTVPVYKITIRDGKQVLTKVETDASNITNLFNDSAKTIELNGELKQETVCKVDSNNDITTITECRTFNDNDVSDKVSCEVKQAPIICKNDNQNDVADVKNDTDVKDVGSDGNNKSSDKENRDSHKKDDKSSSSSSSDNKKSNHHSSSKSSSRHGSSSSSRSSSNSHRSSSHRSSSKSSSSSSSKSSRDKDRHSSSSSSKHSSSSSSSKSKSDRDKERDKEKEKLKKDQAEKDKATLEKVQAPSLGSKFGKIPKKKAEDEKTTGSDPLRKSSTDSRDSSKENKDKGDSKKSPSNQGVLEKKNISISIENKKNSQETVRPKTVKTFNSKFRSTGLEEEVKPPPPRSTAGKKTTTQIDKKIILPKLPSLKRTSPLRDTGATADKRAKLVLDSPVTPPPDDSKKGAIKLIPPKPKPMVLQESDMFMDALTASTKNKEPRKRKRRTSISKDTDSKKSEGANADITRDGTSPPSSSPSGGDERSALSLKPEFKFYQDTLETDEDKERSQDDKDNESPDEKNRDQSMEYDDDDDERSRTPTCDDDSQDAKAPASPDDPEDTGRKPPASPNAEIRYVDGLRSVLLLQKRKGPKKSLKWKTELESVRYFELDETERVNVTKTFTDMKQMEKQNEREAFQMARKLSTEDLMEEKTRWNILIPIDLPAALVEPGKDSKEKDIQYAREKGILQALYFNRSMIPDSPAEPDEERHHLFTDAKIIPLDDLTGNKESEKDFTSVPWPDPKPQLAPVPPVPANILYPPFPQHNQAPMPGLPLQPLGMGPMIGPMTQQMPPSLIPPMNHMGGGVQDVGAGGWRTGDGKVVVPDISNMNNMPNMTGNIPTGYPPPIDTSIMPPGMMPPPGMFNQQDGYPGMMPPDDGNYGHMSNNFQGPGMFVPGPNFQTGPPPPPRGAVMNPMHNANRGRGGPGWFRGGVGPIRGGGGGVGGGGGGGGAGGGWGGRGGGWRGNGKQPPVCRQFTKNGYCRAGDKCQYLHPGLNCPPF
ncbi:hypothetical protein PV328_005653 [Microctonus aethiopoides]|uniref:Serine/threonine-protein phosphatase 1 regulatory subunit 10 n=1 Tax=Microctonus aethiopoides TaxID=144406 RepID=A0AA39FMQ5_9HYME|nr:hypothetical protein PV328_005653 [Microctonus aethiopoides]